MRTTRNNQRLPLSREIAIHEIRAVTHTPSDRGFQLLKERQPAAALHLEERRAGDLEEADDLRRRIAAAMREVAVATRLLRWRRRRLERVLATHRDTLRRFGAERRL